jgi:hypothetical protein
MIGWLSLELEESLPISRPTIGSINVMERCGMKHKKEFAMDFGAVIEGYLPNNAFIRFDIGDTYLKFGETAMLFSGSGVRWINHRYGEDNRHHFHFTIGFGIGI